VPNEFPRSPEIDAYNDTLSSFRHAPGKHVWFLPTPEYESIKSALNGDDDFVPMASVVNSEGGQTMVYTCSAKSVTVLVEDVDEDTAIVSIRAKELEHLVEVYRYLWDM
jgi:hypothetical protein